MMLFLCQSSRWDVYTWTAWTLCILERHEHLVCTLERHKHLAERHFTLVSLSTETHPCCGKPITMLCRELRNSINMHKINTGWIQLWASAVDIVYLWHGKMYVFICLRRWLKIVVYLFIQAFKIEDDVKYWRIKLSSVLALRTVSLSVYWHSRLLKFWLCTPSYSSVARILAASGASYHSDCPSRQFYTFRRLQLFIEFLLLDSAISQLLSLKSFNLKYCICHPFDSAAWGGEDTHPPPPATSHLVYLLL